MEKLLVALPASILAAGVVSNLPDTLTLDPNIPADVQAENSMAWEVYRIFYHAISKTLTSPDWPTPAVDPSGLLGKLGPLLSNGLQALLGSGPLAAVVQGLLKSVGTATAGPLPNGGDLK